MQTHHLFTYSLHIHTVQWNVPNKNVTS